METKEVRKHIEQAVSDSQCTESEIVNAVYAEVKPHASRSAKSALRKKLLGGSYFGENFVFTMELLKQCGLDIVVRD